jgi:RimJ/RimL family protein N-acetyltransferase
MASPDFSSFKKQSVVSAKTKKKYALDRITALPDTRETVENLVDICNEPDIYNALFRIMCQGKPYMSENARAFLDWAREGWEDNAHFVFVVLDDQERHIGALDIKSADLEGAEIGYWASSRHRGIMTPAVEVLCQVAKRAGYQSLTACAAVENGRSQKILLNNGFQQAPGVIFQNDKNCYSFTKGL